MDHNKIREFVRQAHPKGRALTNEAPGTTADYADGTEQDVDAGNFKLATWKKFDQKSASGGPETEEDAVNRTQSNAQEKFRPRRLTGGSKPTESRPRRPVAGDRPSATEGAGKIALERLQLNPGGAAGDSSQDSLDLVVDEEHGIIGESDSGPETPRKR